MAFLIFSLTESPLWSPFNIRSSHSWHQFMWEPLKPFLTHGNTSISPICLSHDSTCLFTLILMYPTSPSHFNINPQDVIINLMSFLTSEALLWTVRCSLPLLTWSSRSVSQASRPPVGSFAFCCYWFLLEWWWSLPLLPLLLKIWNYSVKKTFMR